MNIPGFLIAADAIVACKACGAPVGKPCKVRRKDKERMRPGFVHFGRRVSRLLLTAKMPEERDKIEAELVELLAKELRAKRRARARYKGSTRRACERVDGRKK